MKTVSEKELNRMKKRGGVKVKRRRGAQKLPEPVATESKDLSGLAATEQSVPASVPAPTLDLQPIASMAASMAARDAQLETVITNNTRVVEQFRKDLADVKKPRKQVPWEHDVKRTDKGLIDKVISTPMEKSA